MFNFIASCLLWSKFSNTRMFRIHWNWKRKLNKLMRRKPFVIFILIDTDVCTLFTILKLNSQYNSIANCATLSWRVTIPKHTKKYDNAQCPFCCAKFKFKVCPYHKQLLFCEFIKSFFKYLLHSSSYFSPSHLCSSNHTSQQLHVVRYVKTLIGNLLLARFVYVFC